MDSLVFLCFLFNLLTKAGIVHCVNYDLHDILSKRGWFARVITVFDGLQ